MGGRLAADRTKTVTKVATLGFMAAKNAAITSPRTSPRRSFGVSPRVTGSMGTHHGREGHQNVTTIAVRAYGSGGYQSGHGSGYGSVLVHRPSARSSTGSRASRCAPHRRTTMRRGAGAHHGARTGAHHGELPMRGAARWTTSSATIRGWGRATTGSRWRSCWTWGRCSAGTATRRRRGPRSSTSPPGSIEPSTRRRHTCRRPSTDRHPTTPVRPAATRPPAQSPIQPAHTSVSAIRRAWCAPAARRRNCRRCRPSHTRTEGPFTS